MAKITESLTHTIKNTAHLADNSSDYKSLKQFGKEYLAEEKGSTVRGLLYAVPAAVAGGVAAYYLGNKMRPLVKKMPTAVQRNIRDIMAKTDIGARLKPSVMDTPIMKKILKLAPDITRDELYQQIKEDLSNPSMRTGLAGAFMGLMAGKQVGEFHGGLKPVRKIEEEAGYVPSTRGQYVGRAATGFAGGTVGALAGVAAGSRIAKAIPNIPGGSPGVKALNVAKNIISYGVPAYLLEQAGEGVGEYVGSRFLQKHRLKDEGTAR
jgi:hypothetical protein